MSDTQNHSARRVKANLNGWWCTDCGAQVADPSLHEAWHADTETSGESAPPERDLGRLAYETHADVTCTASVRRDFGDLPDNVQFDWLTLGQTLYNLGVADERARRD